MTVVGLWVGFGCGRVGVGEEGGRALGKVMLCTDEAPLLLMIKTGGEADGEVGLAGERETTAPSGRVQADEPGKSVVGEQPGGREDEG
jgi:hypothetical protein